MVCFCCKYLFCIYFLKIINVCFFLFILFGIWCFFVNFVDKSLDFIFFNKFFDVEIVFIFEISFLV